VSECEKESNNGRCCCNCNNRLTDHSSPNTDGKPISEVRGFICFIENDGKVIAFSGWREHGLCELWESKIRKGVEFK
jgi:hypothetical protein